MLIMSNKETTHNNNEHYGNTRTATAHSRPICSTPGSWCPRTSPRPTTPSSSYPSSCSAYINN